MGASEEIFKHVSKLEADKKRLLDLEQEKLEQRQEAADLLYAKTLILRNFIPKFIRWAEASAIPHDFGPRQASYDARTPVERMLRKPVRLQSYTTEAAGEGWVLCNPSTNTRGHDLLSPSFPNRDNLNVYTSGNVSIGMFAEDTAGEAPTTALLGWFEPEQVYKRIAELSIEHGVKWTESD